MLPCDLSDEQVEEIILLQMLTGMSLVECVYASYGEFDKADFIFTSALTIKLKTIRDRLTAEWKEAHSQHTTQGDNDAEKA